MSDESDIVIKEKVDETENTPLTKPKRQRTAKQLEAFKKVQEKRKQNIEIKKKEKLLNSAKLLVEHEGLTLKMSEIENDTDKHEPVVESEESESEEEQIIVKNVKRSKPAKPPKPVKSAKPVKPVKKKKIRKIIIEESESEDEEESEDEYSSYNQRKSKAKVLRPVEKIDYDKYFFV
jgi:hypothetical protein